MLFDVFRHKRHHAGDLPAIKPRIADAVATGSQLVYRLESYEPDYPRFTLDQILNCHEARNVIVTPIGGEGGLRYSDWEHTRRLRVEEAGDGSIGYVHLRAMGSNDITAWYRQFYPVFNRAGLIIDARHNRGGNIDSFILEKLMRQPWFYWSSRVGQPTWNMQYAPRGHMVVLSIGRPRRTAKLSQRDSGGSGWVR